MALVLIVDDAVEDQNILKEFLSLSKHEYRAISSEAAAIKMIETNQFDLIIFNHRMTSGDGLGFLEKLKTLPKAPPVIILSDDFRYDPDHFLKAGAAAHCFKPIIWVRLEAVIARLLN